MRDRAALLGDLHALDPIGEVRDGALLDDALPVGAVGAAFEVERPTVDVGSIVEAMARWYRARSALVVAHGNSGLSAARPRPCAR
jgi:hypothetical protein